MTGNHLQPPLHRFPALWMPKAFLAHVEVPREDLRLRGVEDADHSEILSKLDFVSLRKDEEDVPTTVPLDAASFQDMVQQLLSQRKKHTTHFSNRQRVKRKLDLCRRLRG